MVSSILRLLLHLNKICVSNQLFSGNLLKMASPIYDRNDLSTLSNYASVVSTHINLVWGLDFDNQTISGTAEHTIKVLVGGTKTADFDSSKLVFVGDVLVNGVAATVTTSDANPVLGKKISVEIPEALQAEDSTFSVVFTYNITTEATALQWLAPSATKGGVHPYLFTQCQAIHARSILPCMDSPAVKTTYSASITAPSWCTVLMSALATSSTVNEDAKTATFHWNQPVPTPAYLIALAAGNLASRDVSERVRIWAEPEVVEAAHFEFSETEEFLSAAESLTCPYQWGRYDVLCLPPSFPYGGMENPCLTFATPTLLAGDRSLADVIAHEIAHSWTGNLVTNHTWAHFWLNEGWTMWLERKVTSKVFKNPELGRLSAQLYWKDMSDDIVRMGGEDGEFTGLIWPLTAADPDDAFSSVPYEKGFNLLNYLEGIVGTPVFMEFAKAYINKFKFSTVTSGEFRDTFLEFVKTAPETTEEAKTVLSALDWDSLFLSKGLPKYPKPDFSNSLAQVAEALAAKWIAIAETSTAAGAAPDASSASAADIEGWSTKQKTIFLDLLIVHSEKSDRAAEEVYTPAFVDALQATYNFNASKNAEIMLRWHTIAMQSECAWILPAVVDFMTTQGRMKFVRPLYRTLRATEMGRQLAVDTFEKFKEVYHPIARKMIAVDLQRAAEQEAVEAAAENNA